MSPYVPDRIESGVGFWKKGETGVTEKKPLGATE